MEKNIYAKVILMVVSFTVDFQTLKISKIVQIQILFDALKIHKILEFSNTKIQRMVVFLLSPVAGLLCFFMQYNYATNYIFNKHYIFSNYNA